MFEKIFFDFCSIHWWVTVVVVGLLINLMSAYLKPYVDRWNEKFSDVYRSRNEKKRFELNEKAKIISKNTQIMIHELSLEFDNRLNFLIFFIFGFIFGGISIMLKTYKSYDLYILVVMGITSHIVALIFLKIADDRSYVLNMARLILERENAN